LWRQRLYGKPLYLLLNFVENLKILLENDLLFFENPSQEKRWDELGNDSSLSGWYSRMGRRPEQTAVP
jgi:hypothetical protein